MVFTCMYAHHYAVTVSRDNSPTDIIIVRAHYVNIVLTHNSNWRAQCIDSSSKTGLHWSHLSLANVWTVALALYQFVYKQKFRRLYFTYATVSSIYLDTNKCFYVLLLCLPTQLLAWDPGKLIMPLANWGNTQAPLLYPSIIYVKGVLKLPSISFKLSSRFSSDGRLLFV